MRSIGCAPLPVRRRRRCCCCCWWWGWGCRERGRQRGRERGGDDAEDLLRLHISTALLYWQLHRGWSCWFKRRCLLTHRRGSLFRWRAKEREGARYSTHDIIDFLKFVLCPARAVICCISFVRRRVQFRVEQGRPAVTGRKLIWQARDLCHCLVEDLPKITADVKGYGADLFSLVWPSGENSHVCWAACKVSRQYKQSEEIRSCFHTSLLS